MSENPEHISPRARTTLALVGLFCLHLMLVALTLRDALFDPLYTNDAIDYMIVATEEAYRHPWDPMVDRNHALDTGHPLLIPYLCGVAWHVFGQATWVLHLAIWLCAALAMTSSHVLGRIVFQRLDPRSARLAAWLLPLMLLSHPVFISNTAQYLNEVPMTAFTVALIASMIARRPAQPALWATLLALTRLPGIVSVAMLAVAELAIQFFVLKERDYLKLIKSIQGQLIAAAILAGYLFVKMVIRDRPLTDYAQNVHWNFSFSYLVSEAKGIWISTFAHPNLGLFPIFALACVGAVILLRMRWRSARQDDSRSPTDITPLIRLACYGAILMLGNVLFYSTAKQNNNPRYFLMFYPMILVGGVATLLYLSKGRKPIWISLCLLWITLQISRWHSPTWEPTREMAPKLHAYLAPRDVMNCMDYRDSIIVFEEMIADLNASDPPPQIISGFPSSQIYTSRTAGFDNARLTATPIVGMMTAGELNALAGQLRADSNREVILAIHARDLFYASLMTQIAESSRVFSKVKDYEINGKLIGTTYRHTPILRRAAR